MADIPIINSLVVALEPDTDAEEVAEEIEERDDVVAADVLEVTPTLDEEVDDGS